MKNTEQLGYYLAGLIEGDASIWTPKTFLPDKYNSNPRISIAFHKNEIPLFEHIISIFNAGGIYIPKEGNTCYYSIAKTDKLIEIINLINGKFRTPKIMSLHKAIDQINLKHNLNIPKLPLDKSNLLDSPWLSGFTDADGNFMISLTGNYALNSYSYKKRVKCIFGINQRLIDKLTGDSCNYFMTEIAELFHAKIRFQSDNAIRFTVSANNKHHLILLYFDKYPLMSSKYLNYLDFKKGLNYLGKSLTNQEIIEIQNIKNSMNSQRIYYNWDHLHNFYK